MRNLFENWLFKIHSIQIDMKQLTLNLLRQDNMWANPEVSCNNSSQSAQTLAGPKWRQSSVLPLAKKRKTSVEEVYLPLLLLLLFIFSFSWQKYKHKSVHSFLKWTDNKRVIFIMSVSYIWVTDSERETVQEVLKKGKKERRTTTTVLYVWEREKEREDTLNILILQYHPYKNY